MNTLRFALVGCLLATSAYAAENAPPPQPDDVVQFRFVAQQGETGRLRVVTRTFGTMNMFGSMLSQKFSQQFEQELLMKCIEVRPDKASVWEMALPEVAMRMNMGGIKIEIDTRDKNPPASTQPVFDLLHRIFTSMTRIKCTVTFSAEGEPLKVEGLSEGMKTIMDEVSDQLMPGMKQFFDQFREYLADNIMEEQMRSSFRIFPDGGQARIGDKWTREWQVKLPPFNVLTEGKGEYELLGIEEFRGRPCAKIRVKSSMTTVPGSKPDPSKLRGVPKGIFERMQFSMNASGGNGIAYLDYTNGDLLQLQETQRTTLEISMDADPDAEDAELKEGLGKITQRLTTSMQLELLEKNGQPLAGVNGEGSTETR
jgi:hypothetical protein